MPGPGPVSSDGTCSIFRRARAGIVTVTTMAIERGT
jgi:hypothetical protein